MNKVTDSGPLRICILSYRSKPHCGGQGVYVANLSNALHQLGHSVDVLSGPPYPELTNGARLRRLPSLDLYNPDGLFRKPSFKELSDPVNLIEWLDVCTMGFPEPLTFGVRASRALNKLARYDIIHDNQSLSYGLWAIARRLPTVATIHHPITVDKRLAVRAENSFYRKVKQLRWFSFVNMQKRVAPALKRIITVSKEAGNGISREFGISESKITVVANGIDTQRFYPIAGIAPEPDRLIVTTSSDTPLKGLAFLLHAIAKLAPKRPKLKLIVVGAPQKNSPIPGLIKTLGIGNRITFTGILDHETYVRQYARAAIAVVPSLYEGFGLPVGEAMACAKPVISTTGGALPEVAGDAGILVPPADSDALAGAIALLLDHPDKARHLGQAGRQRILKHFTWKQAALKTVAAYHRTIHDYRRF
ncbi:MAG: glycosyltransferase family 4 protein [Desulfobacteraceae bacterium]|nr:glycosyltransferase family 4 protein [Desulfobacteraceae bacterium]